MKLSSYYKQLQTEKNIPVKGVASKNVKRKLQLEFGGELLFYQENRTQSEFVYHESVRIKEDERSCFFMNIEEKEILKLFYLRLTSFSRSFSFD